MNAEALTKIINSYVEVGKKNVNSFIDEVIGDFIAFDHWGGVVSFQFAKTCDGLELRIFGKFGHFAIDNPILQFNATLSKLFIHFNGGKIDFWVDENERKRSYIN